MFILDNYFLNKICLYVNLIQKLRITIYVIIIFGFMTVLYFNTLINTNPGIKQCHNIIVVVILISDGVFIIFDVLLSQNVTINKKINTHFIHT